MIFKSALTSVLEVIEVSIVVMLRFVDLNLSRCFKLLKLVKYYNEFQLREEELVTVAIESRTEALLLRNISLAVLAVDMQLILALSVVELPILIT